MNAVPLTDYLEIAKQAISLANFSGLYDLVLQIKPNHIYPKNGRKTYSEGQVFVVDNVKYMIEPGMNSMMSSDLTNYEVYQPLQSPDEEPLFEGEYILTGFLREWTDEKTYRALQDQKNLTILPDNTEYWEEVVQEEV